MKKKVSTTVTREIAASHELLKRSRDLLSELGETVERSRKVLAESHRIIANVKVQRFSEYDPET